MTNTEAPGAFRGYTAPKMWANPHIAAQLVSGNHPSGAPQLHREGSSIDEAVEFILATTSLPSGASVLDLGCGIGPYARRFAAVGMSQSQLARAARVSQPNLPAYENGRREPTPAVLERIRIALLGRPSQRLNQH